MSFLIGDKVAKTSGYPFDGIVRSVFANSDREVRVVVEMDRGFKGDVLHIFSPNQLQHRGDEHIYENELPPL